MPEERWQPLEMQARFNGEYQNCPMFTFTSKQFLIHGICKTAVLGAFAFLSPAQALQWNIDNGTQTDTAIAITGSFNIDDELLPNPVLLASDVTLDGLVFGISDVINISTTPGVGVLAIDWLDASNNLLSFSFDTPLTPLGGTVTLNNVVSTYTPISSGLPSFISGTVSGATSAVPGPLPAMGAGAALVWSRKIRRKISMASQSQ